MHKKINAKRTLMILALALSGMTLLSGCGSGLTALPDEERYQYINEVKDIADPESAGKITTGGYDTGDGVFSPSSYRVTIEGKDTYNILKERLKEAPENGCQEAADTTYISCKIKQADIKITRKTIDATETKFEIVDTMGGRNSNDK
jgi:hypothetical protein